MVCHTKIDKEEKIILDNVKNRVLPMIDLEMKRYLNAINGDDHFTRIDPEISSRIERIEQKIDLILEKLK